MAVRGKKSATKTSGDLPTSVKLAGQRKHTKREVNVGGGKRVTSRNGVYQVKFLKPTDIKTGWFQTVREKPDEVNWIFDVEIIGPGKEPDQGIKIRHWVNLSGAAGPETKRPELTNMAWIVDALYSVGLPEATVTKLIDLEADDIALSRLTKILDAKIANQSGFVMVLNKKKESNKGREYVRAEVISVLPQVEAQERIDADAYKSEIDADVLDLIKSGPRAASDADADFDEEDSRPRKGRKAPAEDDFDDDSDLEEEVEAEDLDEDLDADLDEDLDEEPPKKKKAAKKKVVKKKAAKAKPTKPAKPPKEEDDDLDEDLAVEADDSDLDFDEEDDDLE